MNLNSINDLKSWNRNPREITGKAKEGLKVSIDQFGDLSGIVYNRRLEALVCGHQRLQAIREKYGSQAKLIIEGEPGHEFAQILLPTGDTFDVRLVDWDETKHAIANITANNQHISGDYTAETADLLAQIESSTPELYAMLELDPLSNDLGQGKSSGDGADDFTETTDTPARTKLGDIYGLGDHRLICGDSTDPAVLDALMEGLKARMINTDPPYGVSYKADGFDIIRNDDKRDEQLIALLKDAFEQAVRHSSDDAAFYIWHASSTRPEFEWAMTATGLEEKQYIIWVKDSFVMGRADYQWGHEPCYYAQKRGRRAFFNGDRDQPTVWRIQQHLDPNTLAITLSKGLRLATEAGRQLFITDRPPKQTKAPVVRLGMDKQIVFSIDSDRNNTWAVSHSKQNYDHPTQKPPALAVRAIKNSTKPGDLVLDVFSGSGFTLIGAQRTGRKARCVELDPKYCDVIVSAYCREAKTDKITLNGQPITWEAK